MKYKNIVKVALGTCTSDVCNVIFIFSNIIQIPIFANINNSSDSLISRWKNTYILN